MLMTFLKISLLLFLQDFILSFYLSPFINNYTGWTESLNNLIYMSKKFQVSKGIEFEGYFCRILYQSKYEKKNCAPVGN